MSLSSFIELKFNSEINFIEIIDCLENNGWMINDHGKISFMDNDLYEWKDADFINKNEILMNLKKRFDVAKDISIVVSYKMIYGIQLSFVNKKILILNIDINRKKIDGLLNTDFSFYISILSPIIKDSTIICTEIP